MGGKGLDKGKGTGTELIRVRTNPWDYLPLF